MAWLSSVNGPVEKQATSPDVCEEKEGAAVSYGHVLETLHSSTAIFKGVFLCSF